MMRLEELIAWLPRFEPKTNWLKFLNRPNFPFGNGLPIPWNSLQGDHVMIFSVKISSNLRMQAKPKTLVWDPEKLGHTKRQVLSPIAKLFDPIGWLTPNVVLPKIIL